MKPEDQKQKIDWCLEMLVNRKCGNPFMSYRNARAILKNYAFGIEPIVMDKDELISMLLKAIRRMSLIYYYPRTANSVYRKQKEETDEEDREEQGTICPDQEGE